MINVISLGVECLHKLSFLKKSQCVHAASEKTEWRSSQLKPMCPRVIIINNNSSYYKKYYIYYFCLVVSHKTFKLGACKESVSNPAIRLYTWNVLLKSTLFKHNYISLQLRWTNKLYFCNRLDTVIKFLISI